MAAVFVAVPANFVVPGWLTNVAEMESLPHVAAVLVVLVAVVAV